MTKLEEVSCAHHLRMNNSRTWSPINVVVPGSSSTHNSLVTHHLNFSQRSFRNHKQRRNPFETNSINRHSSKYNEPHEIRNKLVRHSKALQSKRMNSFPVLLCYHRYLVALQVGFIIIQLSRVDAGQNEATEAFCKGRNESFETPFLIFIASKCWNAESVDRNRREAPTSITGDDTSESPFVLLLNSVVRPPNPVSKNAPKMDWNCSGKWLWKMMWNPSEIAPQMLWFCLWMSHSNRGTEIASLKSKTWEILLEICHQSWLKTDWNCSDSALKHSSGIIFQLLQNSIKSTCENIPKVLWNCLELTIKLHWNQSSKFPKLCLKKLRWILLWNCSENTLRSHGKCRQNALKMLQNCTQTTQMQMLWKSTRD